MHRRRSHPRVTADAPTHEELLPLVESLAAIADHAALRPWRLIELRGAARERLGDAFVASSGLAGEDAARLAAKPLRASLLIAVVVAYRESFKVTDWEQEAVASGVAHTLSLLLDEAGWGVMWRTGGHTRAEAVRWMHGLQPNEQLLGWLYVGGVLDEVKSTPRLPLDPGEFLSVLG
nr:nitroreductase family protein [Galbitalea soli]